MTKRAKAKIIKKTILHVKRVLEGEASGHDWWHVYRVHSTARKIAAAEKADSFLVEMSALLHDIADYKLHGGDTEIGPQTALKWLEEQKVEEHYISSILTIIRDISFKGAKVKNVPLSLEGKIVQDADRLDAIGAIGIGRCFAFSGNQGRSMFNPEIAPRGHRTFNAYKSNKSSAINHFYEKLLLLKSLMNTRSAKLMAEKRHKFMLTFLQQFYAEVGSTPTWAVLQK